MRRVELERDARRRARKARRKGVEKKPLLEALSDVRWERMETRVAVVGSERERRQWPPGWYSWQEPGDVMPGYADA